MMFGLFRKPVSRERQSPAPTRPKKEVKSWGKRERLLVVILFLITVLAGILSWLISQGFSLPSFSVEAPSTTIELEK